jgi:hypothetical protein
MRKVDREKKRRERKGMLGDPRAAQCEFDLRMPPVHISPDT